MRHDDIRPGLRTLGYRRRATIAFHVEADQVTIVRIFHHGRDVVFSAENDDVT
jgi:toxin ParE1/3/4